MPLNIAALRAATPGVDHVMHLNNAGASLQPQPVAAAVRAYLDDELIHGGYETADARVAEIEDFYPAIAELIGASPHEIGFLDSATRAWQMAFYSLRLGPGDEVLTTTTEYHSNYLAYLHLAERNGIKILVAPDVATGEIDVAGLADMIGSKTKLISLNHIPTNSGLVNPAAEVGKVARAAGVPFLLDGCQSVGQLPVDVKEIGCDFFTATGRKFMRGPRGTGFLYISEERIADTDPIVVDGRAAAWTARDSYELHPTAKRFEVWEQDLAAKVGLGVAARYAVSVGSIPAWERIQALAERLRGHLAAIPGVTVQDRGSLRGGIVTFTADGVECEALSSALRAKHINTSWATVASARLDMEQRGLAAVVRASVHYFNTEGELDALVAAIAEHLASD